MVSALCHGLGVGTASARTTVLLVGIQQNGQAHERTEQAVAARLKRLGDTVVITPRTPIGPEFLGCDEPSCFLPIAERESADFVMSGRVTSSDHARLARLAIFHSGRKEVLVEESGCEDCHERTIVDLTASLAAQLLDKALTMAPPAATVAPAEPASRTPTPVCPPCATAVLTPYPRPLSRGRKAAAGVLGVVSAGAFSIAVAASFADGLRRGDNAGYYNGAPLMGAFYPISALTLGGLILTIALPERGEK